MRDVQAAILVRGWPGGDAPIAFSGRRVAVECVAAAALADLDAAIAAARDEVLRALLVQERERVKDALQTLGVAAAPPMGGVRS